MLEAKFSDSSTIKKVLEAIKDLVEDANFECAPTGISLQAMDSSHVSLVSVQMRSDGFEEYRCDRVIPLGVNLTQLSKILKCANNNDHFTMRAGEGGDKLQLQFSSSGRVSDFEMKLLDINSDPLGIPDAEFHAVVDMPSIEFQKICRDLQVLGDTVQLSVNKGGLTFSVTGDMGSGKIAISGEGGVDEEAKTRTQIDMREPVSLTFALRYLNFFTKATSLSDQVVMKLSKELPLVIEYNMAEIGFIRYYLAPKIEEDV